MYVSIMQALIWRAVECVSHAHSIDLVVSEDGSTYYWSLFGTLRRFQSSDHVNRDFCGECSASVFFHTSERAGTLDIARGCGQKMCPGELLVWMVRRTDAFTGRCC